MIVKFYGKGCIVIDAAQKDQDGEYIMRYTSKLSSIIIFIIVSNILNQEAMNIQIYGPYNLSLAISIHPALLIDHFHVKKMNVFRSIKGLETLITCLHYV